MLRMQKILTLVAFGLALSFAMAKPARATVDNTTCQVLSNSDSVDDFNSLRRKVEQGFNRKQDFRMCTDLIKFTSGGDMTIVLSAPLHFNNDQDLDCQGDSPACKDGIAFMLDGTPNGGKVVIDTTALSDDKCAIEVTASRVTMRGFTVKTKQSNLVTANKNTTSGVICDNGNNNDFSGVEIDHSGGGTEVCGNNVKEGNEECDDGNTVSGDGCSSACTKEPDADGDGIPDDVDNCPAAGDENKNPGQEDCDHDGKGDACDTDWDNDGKVDGVDNCAPDHNTCQDATTLAGLSNADQADMDGDEKGDKCDDDIDGDGRPNASDNCPKVANPDQEDKDGDGLGAACDPDDTPTEADTDGDGVVDSADNCPANPNADQLDTDSDSHGDVCDSDDDNDGLSDTDEGTKGTDPLDPDTDNDSILDGADSCPKNPDPSCGTPEPTDNPTNNDVDGDGVANANDNCPNAANADQKDGDGDGIGDACDLDNPEADSDGDGAKNGSDNCPSVSNGDQKDTDGDKLGDACDPAPSEPSGGSVDKGGGGCFNSLSGNGSFEGDAWFVTAALLWSAVMLRVKRRKA
ncbi:MAG: thrombospondin type 3 repeat-containing protein [bacterium]